ncbi:MAG: hypothetical protein E7659_05205 [Ruminococcaceae bacterium]|nr:hypothetical protein [Oscillospiraceae bacterium]
MGKGKRNKQLRLNETEGAPQKRENKTKKQFVMPVWAKRALCIVLLVAVLAGIIAAALISGGAILRNRILVESKTGKFDVNQQMATFILWFTMYQQAANEWQDAYMQYQYQQLFGGGSSTNSSILNYSQEYYSLSNAAYYTKQILNTGLHSIKDYLIELVAGADAAIEAGMKFEAHDKQDAKDVVTWMKNLYVGFGLAEEDNANRMTFDYFLTEYVGEDFKASDIEDAAKVMIMYSKYSDYMNFTFQNEATQTDLQNYIDKNPAGFFQTKYYTFTGAEESMIREFYSDKFIEERFESTVAKHFATVDRLTLVDLEGNALTAKIAELGLNTTTKYTKTTDADGKVTYSPNLPDALGEYIFGASNKAGTFASVTGEKCAYLVYFEKTSTATEATVSFKEYKYEDYKDNLSEIENLKDLIAECIKGGKNTTDSMTAKEKADDLLAKMQDDLPLGIPEDQIIAADTTKDLKEDDANTVPEEILDRLYDEDTTVYKGWKFIANNSTTYYVVKVDEVLKDENDKPTTNYKILYVALTDDLFASVLDTFEAEYNLYLLETKVEAPSYKQEFKPFAEKVVNWLMKENFKELVLTRYANAELKDLLAAKSDTDKQKLTDALNTLFTNGIQDFTKGYNTKKEFETKYDSAVYDYIFNSKNKDSATVIVGEDDRVFLVYVAPVTEEEEGHEGHDHSKIVHAAIKEYNFADYEASLKIGEGEDAKTFAEQIVADLLAEGRKNTTSFKAAEELAKAEFDDLKKTENAKTWEDFETQIAIKPKDGVTSPVPDAIINKIFPAGSKAEKIELTADTYYQVDSNGTSYVFKLTEINSKLLSCTVEYKEFKDDEYYSYFRAIKSKLDGSLKEEATTLKYPQSITTGSYQDWLFKGEYKDGPRTFDRQKGDMTFIATTDSKSNITSLTIYIVEEPAKQVNDENETIYAIYQLYETEKEAKKALKKLGGKTGFALLDLFSSLKITKTMKEGNEEGYYPGYVVTSNPQVGVDFTKSDITDENLKNWLFDDARQAFDMQIIESKDGKGYYLALYASGEQAWTRNARTAWTSEKFAAHMKDVIANGGYEFNEDAMSKIEGVLTTTTAPATTTKP